MTGPLLRVDNLCVSVEGKQVLQIEDWEVNAGEVVALVGANGSGKSSLAMTLMGDTRYQTLDASRVVFDGKDLIKMSVDERAKAGLFVAWQSPMSIPGISVFNLCKSSFEAKGQKIEKLTDFKQKLEKIAVRVGLSKEHIAREINVGFSGGEKKRLELLQLILLGPKLAILDEIDSGIDADGTQMVVEVANEMKKNGTAIILITHNKNLLNNILVDRVGEMKYGQLSARV